MTITSVPTTTTADPEAAARFAAAVEPLLAVLLRGARRLTHGDADAEDLLQDTLLHAYTGFHTFKEGTNLQAWMFRIQYNRWVSAHRSKQRRPLEVSAADITDGDLAVSATRLSAAPRSAEAEVLDGLPDADVRAALAALPEGFRAALYYADVQGYTYAETAALLRVPPGTVMSRVSRGRQRLRVALAHLDHTRADNASAEQSVA